MLSLVLPNPHHPLTPQRCGVLTPRPGRLLRERRALTFVASRHRRGVARGVADDQAVGGSALFGTSRSAVVHIAGLNTQLPGPWAFLRYAPIIGLARTPGRFTVMLMLAVAVLFGCALYWMGQRWPARRRAILVTVAVLLLFELLPAPRPLYSAAIPRIYRHVTSAAPDIRVLELPFGVRDGTSSAATHRAVA